MLLQTQFFSSLQFQYSSVVLSPSVCISYIKSEKGSSESSSSDGSGRKGFGSSSETGGGVSSKRKQKKGQRERASIIRRTPLEKPPFVSKQQQVGGKVNEEESKNESAFLLAWLGFGVVILVEGISLAASGFLPEQWDQLFVKYLYPSFTPTVFLFVAGGVVYGVFKYLQNEKITDQK